MSYARPAVGQIVDAVGRWRLEAPGRLVVAIDGHGAAGKSVLAAATSDLLAASLVHLDDFFRAAGSSAGAGEGPMGAYYDWERLRREALEPLRRGARAGYHAFDWETNGFLPGLIVVESAELILVEGVSSTAAALADLVDRTVLVVTPEPERVARLHERIGSEVWDEEWLAAERAYFSERPAGSFDLVVSGSAAVDPPQTHGG
jgi:uridine kinase